MAVKADLKSEFESEKDVIIFQDPPVEAGPAGKERGEQSEQETNQGEEEFVQAYDEETGEINWDCPCLGSMVKPPCGETFKLAFSCFVASKEEPKGADCVDLFESMQNCFQKHPEIYGLDEEENETNEKSPLDAAAESSESKA